MGVVISFIIVENGILFLVFFSDLELFVFVVFGNSILILFYVVISMSLSVKSFFLDVVVLFIFVDNRTLFLILF